MLSRLSVVLLTGLLLLSACGFEPMYGDSANNGAASALRGNLIIDPIGGHTGQVLKASLEDLLNPEGLKNAHPDYHLHITLQQSLIPAVIKSDGTIQRYDVRLDSTFQLTRSADPKKVIFTGTLRRTGSYNVATNANFATYEAGEDIIERTLSEMAEDYVLRLSGYFAGKS